MSEITLDLSRDSFLITDRLFFAILRRLLANEENKYIDNLTYTSPVDDSMIVKISCEGDNEITITRYGENDETIKIQGKKTLVKKFLRQMAVEAATIVTKELFIDSICSEERIPKVLQDIYRDLELLYIEKFDTEKITSTEIQE